MSFLFGAVFVSLAYIIGVRIGRLAPDEVLAGSQYIKLIREASVVATTAIVAYTTGAQAHYLAPIIILAIIIFWREHAKIYPWLFAMLLFLSGELLVTATALLFVAALSTSILHYKKFEEGTFAAYWPLPVTALLLWIIRAVS